MNLFFNLLLLFIKGGEKKLHNCFPDYKYLKNVFAKKSNMDYTFLETFCGHSYI